MFRKFLLFSFISVFAVVILIIICNILVVSSAASHLHKNISTVPENKAGLVLGTSRYLVGGDDNLYFKYRLRAAAQLYKSGKIKVIIVSGDNSVKSYNEPREMKRELVKLGVPPDVIHLDFAGFRTLDSVVRCNKIFGQKSFTIISQKFHNERAVFIARQKDIEAIAYNAQDVEFPAGISTHLREVLARVRVVLDVYFLDTQPKFLGDHIEI